MEEEETIAAPNGDIVAGQKDQAHESDETPSILGWHNFVDPYRDSREERECTAFVVSANISIYDLRDVPSSGDESEQDELSDVGRASKKGS